MNTKQQPVAADLTPGQCDALIAAVQKWYGGMTGDTDVVAWSTRRIAVHNELRAALGSAPATPVPAEHFCALEHGGTFCKVCEGATPVQPVPASEPVLSIKRREWEALSPEAQDKLLKITGAASRNLSRAQAAADVLDKPLCTQPPEGWTCSRGAGHAGPCASNPVQPVPASEPAALRHVCNLWVDPVTRDYVVDRCDHPTSEMIAAYAAPTAPDE